MDRKKEKEKFPSAKRSKTITFEKKSEGEEINEEKKGDKKRRSKRMYSRAPGRNRRRARSRLSIAPRKIESQSKLEKPEKTNQDQNQNMMEGESSSRKLLSIQTISRVQSGPIRLSDLRSNPSGSTRQIDAKGQDQTVFNSANKPKRKKRRIGTIARFKSANLQNDISALRSSLEGSIASQGLPSSKISRKVSINLDSKLKKKLSFKMSSSSVKNSQSQNRLGGGRALPQSRFSRFSKREIGKKSLFEKEAEEPEEVSIDFD